MFKMRNRQAFNGIFMLRLMKEAVHPVLLFSTMLIPTPKGPDLF